MRATLNLSFPDKDGVTLKDHLENLERQTSSRHPDLDSVKIPRGAEYLYDAFWELASDRRLTYSEVDAYSRMKCVDLEPWEVDAIMQMDREYQGFIAEKAKNRGK